MPSLIDIFNPSFFVFLGILVLVVALLVVYFESKMREQNHKITSMFSLVSSMADELNMLKYSISENKKIITSPSTSFSPSQKTENILIEVSDDDTDDESVFSSASSSSSTSSSKDIKVLNISSFSLNIGDKENIDIDCHDIDCDIDCDEIVLDEIVANEIIVDDVEDDDSSSSSEDEKYDLVVQQQNSENDVLEPEFSFKSINISSTEEAELDYKKLSIGRLRKLVQDKKLAEDSSKLKKNELIKLLDDSSVTL